MKQKKSFKERLQNMGPAAITTSAFVGPGTITTTTIAGANFGYSLLWTVLFSAIALMVLMEMAARIGIITQKNIIDAAYELRPNSIGWKNFIKWLMVVASAATAFGFTAGNIIGASLGLASLLNLSNVVASLIIGVVAFSALSLGSSKFLEKAMLFFVNLMSIVFIVTMFLVGPDFFGIIKGMFIPTMPAGSHITAIALIGTTLIAINLVMHSIKTRDKWNKPEDLPDSNFDILFNVIMGGLITMSIVITSATVLYGTGTEINSPIVFVQQLVPVLGETPARILGGLGILAAGLSSTIATAFIIVEIFSEVFHWEGGVSNKKSKVLGLLVIGFGTVLAMLGTKPIQIITLAQVMSGFFLPFISIIIVIVSNNAKMMGEYTNSKLQNIFGVFACLVTLFLGTWGLFGAISAFFS